MYTEKSVEMKSDFYSRYGRAVGHLYFERAGLPCILLKSNTHMMAFSFRCGVRACGRKYGDVLKILDTKSNVCDISFTQGGNGAQILFEKDIDGFNKTDETTAYVIDKLLERMGLHRRYNTFNTLSEFCDMYGSAGWCAYSENDKIRQIPLPLSKYNVVIIKTPKNSGFKADNDFYKLFNSAETRRIMLAAEGLRKCDEKILFDMLNDSQNDIERLMSPTKTAVQTVKIARELDVCAVRICNQGVMCITEKDKTDSTVHRIAVEFERTVGYSATIAVVC